MENITMTTGNVTDSVGNIEQVTNVDFKVISGYNIVSTSIVLLVKKICYIGVVPFLALIGIILNSLCFVMFVRLKNKTSTVVILLALAVVDICILVNGAITSLRLFSVIYGGPLSANQVKQLIPYFSTYIVVLPGRMGNILTLLIAVERLLCVLIPMKIRQYCTKKNATYVAVLSCVCIALFCVPNLFLYVTDKVYSNTTEKYQVIVRLTAFGKRTKLTTAIFVTTEVVFRVVPVVGVAIVSAITTVAVFINARRRSTLTNVSARSRTINKELKVTKTLLTVTSVFVICQMPPTILFLIVFIDPEMTPYRYKNNIYELVYPIIYSFVMFNSVVNFIIYSMTNNTYKTEFKKLFGRVEIVKRTKSINNSQPKTTSTHM